MPSEMEAQAWGMAAQNQHLILDEPDRTFTWPLKCVMVGVNAQMKSGPNQMHYALIVTGIDERETNFYGRVGVGFLEKQQIELDRPSTTVRIR